MQPVEHLEPLELGDAVETFVSRREQLERQVGPSGRPWRSVLSRSLRGVWMRPMKIELGVGAHRQLDPGSPCRTSFRRTTG